ncbi:MAG: hypothetical protein QM753_19380 [Thermomicrobiales bacterium]
MSGESMVRARLLDDGTVVQVMPDGSTQPFAPETDWERLDAMTEEEIEANALSDPDNPPLTDEQLANAWRPRDLRAARLRYNMSQGEFAATFGLPYEDVHAWEEIPGRRPDPAARALIRIILRQPKAALAGMRGVDELPDPVVPAEEPHPAAAR